MIAMQAGKLKVRIEENRKQMGKMAAEEVARQIRVLLNQKDDIRMVFAAAPSQNEFLAEIVKMDLDWHKITAFHMDEYIGLENNAEQLFSRYLSRNIFEKVKFKKVNLLRSANDNPLEECRRYSDLLAEKSIDIVCMGIGENGHIAFNDPPVADFNDKEKVKIVELDLACRQQQVNDGCFASLDEVPQTAISLTVPMLMSANYLSIVVPGERKAEAVFNTIYSNISTECPSTILRTHSNAVMYLDDLSSMKIISFKGINRKVD
jgi:glucosamine-6-phosphate deaminase